MGRSKRAHKSAIKQLSKALTSGRSCDIYRRHWLRNVHGVVLGAGDEWILIGEESGCDPDGYVLIRRRDLEHVSIMKRNHLCTKYQSLMGIEHRRPAWFTGTKQLDSDKRLIKALSLVEGLLAVTRYGYDSFTLGKLHAATDSKITLRWVARDGRWAVKPKSGRAAIKISKIATIGIGDGYALAAERVLAEEAK